MKLFLSFTGLLRAIVCNEVSQDELDSGLFYFGCTRSHACKPGAAGEFDERTAYRENGLLAHEALLRALASAELAGRCRWHRLEEGVPLPAYPLLNELLLANGVPALTFPTELPDYTYCGVRDRVREMGLPVEVQF
jgi:hypothetical protein